MVSGTVLESVGKRGVRHCLGSAGKRVSGTVWGRGEMVSGKKRVSGTVWGRGEMVSGKKRVSDTVLGNTGKKGVRHRFGSAGKRVSQKRCQAPFWKRWQKEVSGTV